MAKREVDVERLNYEQAVERLETLIERIESGEVGLEESLQQYEVGMALIKRCRAILAQAEKKIAELTVDDAGRVRGGDADGDDTDPDEAELDDDDDADNEDER